MAALNAAAGSPSPGATLGHSANIPHLTHDITVGTTIGAYLQRALLHTSAARARPDLSPVGDSSQTSP